MILDRRMLVLAQRIFTPSMLGIALLTASCGSLPKESAEAQSQRPQRESRETAVDVAIARTNSFSPQPEYIGNTAPFRIVSVRSQVEGRLISLNLDIGDTVQRGKIISQLDDTLLLTAVKQAEARNAPKGFYYCIWDTHCLEDSTGHEIVKEITDSSNNELLFALDFLNEDYETTKNMIISLTKHLDSVELVYKKVLKEHEKRHNGKF